MMSRFAEYHAELKSVAREALAASNPRTNPGASVPTDWRLLADSGWLGLEVAEELDGAGATFAEAAVVLSEMGSAAAGRGYLGAAVLGVGALNMLEAGEGRDGLLRRAACGETRLTVALDTEPAIGTTPVAFSLDRSGDRFRLNGEATFVPDVVGADVILVVAHCAGEPVVVALEPDTPGLRSSSAKVTDSTREVASVRAEDVEVGPAAPWPMGGVGDDKPWRLFDRGALALACDSLGGAEAMLAATVEYVKVREQFGRPIGSFQAVKHACADMLVQITVGRQLAALAVTSVADGDPDSWVAVSQAKAYVCQVAVEVAGKAMQLHGGIGYTWESGIHIYLKRALLNRSWFGSPAWHRRRLARRYG